MKRSSYRAPLRPRPVQPKPSVDSFTLKQEEVNALRAQRRVIESQQHILNALQESFIRYIQTTYGVDLAHEEWELDLEEGSLRRATKQPTTE